MVCNLPQGCPIDEKGICENCVEGEDEQELEKEREELEEFWKDVNLKIYGSYGISNFTFRGKNNTYIKESHVEKVDYNGGSIGARLSITSRVSFSVSHLKGTVSSVKIDPEPTVNDNVFTTEMSGDLSYKDFTIDYDLVKKKWDLFVGVGIFSLNSNLNYQDKSYGLFKYEINEESLFFNTGVDFNFSNNSFLGFGIKVFPQRSYKSNSTEKKITQYNAPDDQPIVELSITNLLVSFGFIY